MKLVKFDDFFKLANFFYSTFCFKPYRKQNSKGETIIKRVIFYVGVVNLNLVLLGEILYVVVALSDGNHYLEAIMNMSYVGFVVVGSFKLSFIWWKKSVLTKFISDLQRIFPDNLELQEQYNLQYYWKKCNRTTSSFSLLYMILIWTYNLNSIVQYIIYDKLFKVHEVERALAYFMYIPWDWRDNWGYYALYLSENLSGYMAAAGQISSDLLLMGCTTQLVMHFDFIAHTIANYNIKLATKDLSKEKGHVMDMEFLKNTVQHHSFILDLSERVNDVFGVPLLLNFASSAFVICFVGFQMTTGATLETLSKLFLFFVSSILQIYLICHYSQLLIDASSKVADSVYNQNWSNAHVHYQKMLILMANRAQKPAQLNATTFVFISRGTMTEIMQISYKFFALLRTIYNK